MLCGELVGFDTRHPERNKIHTVTTLPMRDNLLECCGKRRDEQVAETNRWQRWRTVTGSWQHQELDLWQQESEAGSRRARLEETGQANLVSDLCASRDIQHVLYIPGASLSRHGCFNHIHVMET